MNRLSRPLVRLSAGLAVGTALAASLLSTSPAAAAGLTTPTSPCSSTTSGVSVIVASPDGGAPQPACVTQQGNVLVIVLPNSNNSVSPGLPSNTLSNQTPTTALVTPTAVPAPVSTILQQTTPPTTGPLEGDMSAVVDTRIDSYAKRQAIRDQYRGRIDEVTFNDELGDGVTLETALADALAAFGRSH